MKISGGYRTAGIVLLVSIGAWQLSAQEPASFDVDEIIEYIDRLYRAESSYAEFEMEIVTPHWQRTLEMKSWTEGLMLAAGSPHLAANPHAIRSHGFP